MHTVALRVRRRAAAYGPHEGQVDCDMRGILTYHSIDSSGSPISTSQATLRAHVNWLASSEVQVTPLERLHLVPADGDAVAITFDDGFQNFADIAWPLLKHHEMPVTVFVVTQRV